MIFQKQFGNISIHTDNNGWMLELLEKLRLPKLGRLCKINIYGIMYFTVRCMSILETVVSCLKQKCLMLTMAYSPKEIYLSVTSNKLCLLK